MSAIDSHATPFNDDVARHGGYLYASGACLGGRLANEHLTATTLTVADFQGRRVLDIGCGDGTYSVDLYDCGGPAAMQGIDPAPAAIEAACKKIGGRNIVFSVGNAYDLAFADGSFDLAYLRGVLHHMDRPADALREALRVARTIVVIEPNGYSPILKLLERFSAYHRQHGEKSYPPHRLRKWIAELGGEVTSDLFAGLVPMFGSNTVARVAKALEPLVERLPLVRAVGCACYVFTATSNRHLREGRAAA